MPRRFSLALDDDRAYPGLEVRRLLYDQGRSVYKVLYHVIEPLEDETEGIVRILRIRHAAMHPLNQSEEIE
jgi:plasmid stabilization system protein ParE